jgi:tRNA pseudouridine13 synthase
MPLPYATSHIAPISAEIRRVPEDFCVDEIPAYAPSGAGPHLYVRFEKRGLTTPEAIGRLARALGADPRTAGVAGLKDRHAVTSQWASFETPATPAPESIVAEGVRVLEVSRHAHKLRTGHLRGNRFSLRLRAVPPGRVDDVRRVVEALARDGIPNYYGEQRFGIANRNVDLARAWIVGGGRPPRDPFRRKLLVSALQAELFNTVLAERLANGLLATAIDGDLLRKEDTGGLYLESDLDVARARVEAWESSPTGPMFGARMRAPKGHAWERERRVLAAAGLDETHLERFARDGRGTRRVLRYRPAEVAVEVEAPDVVRLRLVLPKGAYATIVLREITKDSRSVDEPLGVDSDTGDGAEASLES